MDLEGMRDPTEFATDAENETQPFHKSEDSPPFIGVAVEALAISIPKGRLATITKHQDIVLCPATQVVQGPGRGHLPGRGRLRQK